MFKTNLFIPSLLSLAIAFSACDNNVDLEKPTEPETKPEIIFPVDFKFITLNNEGNQGETPSISYIKNDGTVLTDYFKAANGFQINDNPLYATQIEESLYLTHGGYWSDNGIHQVNPNTFKEIKSYDLKRDMQTYCMEHIGGDSILIGGAKGEQNYNFAIASLSKNDFILSTFDTGFPIKQAKRIGNKLFAGGTRSQKNGQYIESKLIAFDTNSIDQKGMRTVMDVLNLSSNSAEIIVDKNKNIWVAGAKQSTYVLYCIDPITEQIRHEIPMPYTLSTLNELCYTIDNNGKTIYLRCHKAFFTVDVDSPATPDEPIYEYIKTISGLKDLDMTKDGTLLMIEQDIKAFAPSKIIELNPKNEGNWEIVNEYSVDPVASKIYVAKYEKKY